MQTLVITGLSPCSGSGRQHVTCGKHEIRFIDLNHQPVFSWVKHIKITCETLFAHQECDFWKNVIFRKG